jgi:hypothetical protein
VFTWEIPASCFCCHARLDVSRQAASSAIQIGKFWQGALTGRFVRHGHESSALSVPIDDVQTLSAATAARTSGASAHHVEQRHPWHITAWSAAVKHQRRLFFPLQRCGATGGRRIGPVESMTATADGSETSYWEAPLDVNELMCGIIGIASQTPISSRGWLDVGCTAIAHRGPDDSGSCGGRAARSAWPIGGLPSLICRLAATNRCIAKAVASASCSTAKLQLLGPAGSAERRGTSS